MFKWLMIISLCFSFVGCQRDSSNGTITSTTQTEDTQVSTTEIQVIQSMMFVDSMLEWHPINQADQYKISIYAPDLDQWFYLESQTTSIELIDIPYGKLEVEVQAFRTGVAISNKPKLMVRYRPLLVAPNVIWMENGILHWNPVPEATSYIINTAWVGPFEVDASVTSYDLGAHIDHPAEWNVSIQARHPLVVSEFSDSFQVLTHQIKPFYLNVAYSIASNEDFVFDFGYSDLEIENVSGDVYAFDLQELTMSQGILRISKEYLSSLYFSPFIFQLTTNHGEFIFHLRVFDSLISFRMPMYFVGAIPGVDFNIPIPLLLTRGYFIDGYQMPRDQYTVTEDQISVHHEFVASVLESRPELEFAYFIFRQHNRQFGHRANFVCQILPNS